MTKYKTDGPTEVRVEFVNIQMGSLCLVGNEVDMLIICVIYFGEIELHGGIYNSDSRNLAINDYHDNGNYEYCKYSFI